jgi:hypothetical protein
MKLEALLFANDASDDGWLLAVEGGGWEHITYDFLPGTAVGYVAGILTLDDAELGELTEIAVEIFDDDGQVERFRATMTANGNRPNTVEGVPVRLPFAMPFMTVVRGPTVMKARLMLGDEELGLIACSVQTTTPDTIPDEFEDGAE